MTALLMASFLVPGLAQRLSAPVIVYDNTKTSVDNNFPLLPEWENDSTEAGDEVLLAGTAREVVKLKLIFNYRGTKPGTLEAVIRFRAYDDDFKGPGKVFWESKRTTVKTKHGLHDLVFDIPYIVVPDHFIWTIQVYNRQGSKGELGQAYFNPPTVGTSEDFFWLRGGNEWSYYSWGADPVANFAAQIQAVEKH